MAGLLEKDFRLFLQRKQFFIAILIIALLLSYSTDGTFIVGYLTMIGAIFTVSTISYDEYDNCYPFLMTLPIDNKIYVIEKYVFGIATGGITWLFACALFYLSGMLRQPTVAFGENLPVLAAFVPLFIFIISLSIPFQLKFGAEKSRIALLALFGIFMLMGVLGRKLLEMAGCTPDAVLAKINAIPESVVAVLIMAATLLLMAGSILWSIAIMNKKEY